MNLPAGNKKANLILEIGSILGEGAFWHPTEEVLYWIDIEKKLLHCFDPITQQNITTELEARPGTVVPHRSGGVLVPMQDGIYFLEQTTFKKTFLLHPIQNPTIRYNDGKCDAAGRLWVGTLQLELKAGAAVLYKIDNDRSVEQVVDGVTISNGIIWSLDNTTMFYTDTSTNKVDAFDFDLVNGMLSNRRTIIEISRDMGSPDGMAIDAEGNLWIALYGGSGVGQWNPESGELLQMIELPVPKVTSCAFGGHDLSTLYITTASENMTAEEKTKYPMSGSLFAVEPGVSGIPGNLSSIDIH